MGARGRGGWALFACAGIALVASTIAACSGAGNKGDGEGDTPDAAAPREAPRRQVARDVPNYYAGPPDTSRLVVQKDAKVDVSRPFATRPLREIPNAVRDDDAEEHEHEPGKNPFVFPWHPEPDAVLQDSRPILSMPVTIKSFLGQGATLGHCTFPAPSGGNPAGCVTTGDPPDTVGAVGPNHFVQVVNGGFTVWDKSGTKLYGPAFTNTLFTGYPTTDGNACAAKDWGDGVVLYDQFADRWVITQFDITNAVNSNDANGPSYQCIAVSQGSDPTGAYWLYDFQYSAVVNDYGKFSVWPDGYYVAYNNFNSIPLIGETFTNANLCVWERSTMIAGETATQVCFTNLQFAFLPSNVDGPIKPPAGEPAFFVSLGTNGASIDLFKFHVDYTTTSNSTFTGPTSLPVASFNQLCGGNFDCVTQPSPGNALAALGDRPMFHLSYRNFGAFESLVFNHSVTAGSTGGVRWYENPLSGRDAGGPAARHVRAG